MLHDWIIDWDFRAFKKMNDVIYFIETLKLWIIKIN